MLAPSERLITILATNDLHGGVEPARGRDGSYSGGMAFWSGAVRAIREGLRARYGDERAGVLLLDGGDQFQGTLISNFDEGQLVFGAMNLAGYDAVVPGNHDYDFGPVGWLEDKVRPGVEDQNPRGALERLVAQARFPLLSANTFFCASGERPSFLRPYLVRELAGVRVAVIGIDHPQTPTMTTPENVADLCFRDEAASYLAARAELDGRADVFVLLMHNGNSGTERAATRLAEKLAGRVHAVVAGHTHFVNNVDAGGVPVVQSGSGGELFGRIDLVWDTAARELVGPKRRAVAGARLYFDRCAPEARAFCETVAPLKPGHGPGVAYEGVRVLPDVAVGELIAAARERIAPVAARVLGQAGGEIARHRVNESPLANALTDSLRKASGAEIAFMNTGGIRDNLRAGPVTYEALFRVLPFSNHGVVVAPMDWARLRALLERSAKTCGAYGALMQSGLRVAFERDCKRAAAGGSEIDVLARLVRVETLGGEVLFDPGQGVAGPAAGRVFIVATLDFLAAGGSGYTDFQGVPVVSDLGIVRESLTELFLRHPAQFSSQVDGRWKESLPPI